MWHVPKNVAAGIALGEWLRPVFSWFVIRLVRPKTDTWRYTAVRWVTEPAVTVNYPVWFQKLIMTLCSEPANDRDA